MIIYRKEKTGAIIFNTKTKKIVEIEEELFSNTKIFINVMKKYNIFENNQNLKNILIVNNISNNVLSAPLKIFLSITNECNLQCLHCFNYIDKKSERLKYIDISTLKKIINICKTYGIFELKLSGGEPFLHPNFIKILKLLEKEEIMYTIYTNGSYLSEKNCSILKKLKYLKKIKVSIEGSKEINDYIRGKDSFNNVIKNCKNINSKLIEFNLTLNRYNYKHIFDLVKELNKNNLETTIDLGLIRYNNKIKKTDLVFKSKQEYIEFANYCKKNFFDLKKNKNYFACSGGYSSCAIDVYGNVFPCGMLQHEKKFIIGNINNESFNKIWNDIKMINFNICNECQNCLLFEKGCLGGCRSNAFYSTGDIKGKDPFCTFYQESLNNM